MDARFHTSHQKTLGDNGGSPSLEPYPKIGRYKIIETLVCLRSSK